MNQQGWRVIALFKNPLSSEYVSKEGKSEVGRLSLLAARQGCCYLRTIHPIGSSHEEEIAEFKHHMYGCEEVLPSE